MKDVTHYSFVWHLSVVGMSIIDWIVFTLTHICHKRFIRPFEIAAQRTGVERQGDASLARTRWGYGGR